MKNIKTVGCLVTVNCDMDTLMYDFNYSKAKAIVMLTTKGMVMAIVNKGTHATVHYSGANEFVALLPLSVLDRVIS